MTIACIGLGNMGAPMARCLIAAGPCGDRVLTRQRHARRRPVLRAGPSRTGRAGRRMWSSPCSRSGDILTRGVRVISHPTMTSQVRAASGLLNRRRTISMRRTQPKPLKPRDLCAS